MVVLIDENCIIDISMNDKSIIFVGVIITKWKDYE